MDCLYYFMEQKLQNTVKIVEVLNTKYKHSHNFEVYLIIICMYGKICV